MNKAVLTAPSYTVDSNISLWLCATRDESGFNFHHDNLIAWRGKSKLLVCLTAILILIEFKWRSLNIKKLFW